jgi:uncharacterized membrane protein YciS (DUF1049 family)
MGSTVVAVVLAVLCVLALVFLVYVFVQFWRESTRLKRGLEQKIKESKAQTKECTKHYHYAADLIRLWRKHQ